MVGRPSARLGQPEAVPGVGLAGPDRTGLARLDPVGFVDSC